MMPGRAQPCVDHQELPDAAWIAPLPRSAPSELSCESQLTACAVVPAQHPQSAQRVPAACATDGGLHLERNPFGMTPVERPPSILMAAFDHDLDGLLDAAVRFYSRAAQVIESAQDIVVPERRIGEAEPVFVDHLAGAKRAEQSALQKIIFRLLACLCDGCRFPPSLFAGKQSFQHADRRMER